MTATVMTVWGGVDGAELGFTLPQEHVLIDLVRIFPAKTLAFRFQLLDEERASKRSTVRRSCRRLRIGSLGVGRPHRG